jgi:inosine-uridine nucleoside N-ribohydrolase/uncharacterized membrane protein YdjX (TVP38/TMEM64 family)
LRSGLAIVGIVALALAFCATIPTAQDANDAVLMLRKYDTWAWAVGIALIWADLMLPVPQTVVIAALGIIYGTLVGGLLGSLGLITGGLLGYGLMRTSARWLLQRLVSTTALRRMESLFASTGTWAIVLTRSLPYSIPEAVVLLAGIARMPVAKFTTALAVGSIPTAFAFAAIGAGWAEQPILALVVSYVLPILLLPFALLLMRRRGVFRYTLKVALLLSALVLPLLAVPSLIWRTGRMQVAPIHLQQGGPPAGMARRLWIDTDAACGVGERTDVDDCFALALLIRERAHDIVGISTVLGNAEHAATYKKVLELVDMMRLEGIGPVPVHAGSANPRDAGAPALAGLRDALAQGSLTIISLGPLTNIAAALAERPDLHSNVSRLVAVMGRRPGHLFHPTEGSGSGTLLGHGPIFRDFNFVKDSEAASSVLAMRLPITLIPYDAGRRVVLTAPDLERIGQSGRTMSWISAQSQDWLTFWRRDIGAAGFSPFDLVAAVYFLEPMLFKCAGVRVVVGIDHALWTSRLWTTKALLVEARDDSSSVIYCPDAASGLKSRLVDLLTAKRR